MNLLLRRGLMLTVLLLIPALAAAENPAPTVAITSPEQGVTIASVSVPVTIAYAAPDEASITVVELIVGGAVVARRQLDPPQASGECVLTWPASRYRNGEHDLTVRAVDSEGGSAEMTISVVLRRSLLDRSPKPRIVSPESGETVSGLTQVRVDAEDAARMQYVVFLIDDMFKALTNVRPFTYRWDTTRHLNGPHQLQVKAYSSRGDAFVSPLLEVIVDNPGGATRLMEAATVSGAGPAPEPVAPPARTSALTMPSPRESESLPPLASAPLISPPADLMRPPAPTPSAAEPEPVTIAMLPEVEPASAPAAPEPAAPPARTSVLTMPSPRESDSLLPVASAPSISPPADLMRPPAPAPPQPVAPPAEPEPVTIAMLPEVEPAPSAPEPPAPAAEVTPVAEAVESEPVIEVALLPSPSRPAAPAPRVAPEPVALYPTHVVLSGDHIWKIAAQYGVSPSAIVAANELANPQVIQPGQRLRIPTSPVYFDGRPLVTEAPPIIADGRALVPVRAIVEEVGGTLSWDPEARTARALAAGRDLQVTIGSDVARIDGAAVKMDLPARLRNGRTMVPLRLLGEVFRLALSYDQGVIQIASGR